MRQDITGDDFTALKYFSDWLGASNKNQLVILGDVGSGKSTLVRFLVYDLARNYLKDPVRHPAPVLIPLGEVRKETSLEGVIHEHFSRRNLPVANFRRFEHLVRLGKIILFFDAFDEMADRVSFEDGFNNFREISRAAEAAGKVIVTCRVTYFKDVEEQREMIDEAFRAPGTPFYEKLRERSGNEVVYLKPFDEAKIRSYLAVARPEPDEDWRKIEQIYDLKGLAQLPLLLTMITESLDEFAPGEKVDAAKLYERYTDKWITRDFTKGRVILKRDSKLKLMMELARRVWNNPDSPMRYRELASFVDEMREAGVVEFRGHETEDIIAAIHLRSFLKREGETGFSFIHRSFMEYFLARRLFNGLNNEKDIEIGLLNTRGFNKRIIHFLAMIDRDDSIVPLLSAILAGSYHPNISENALEILYWGGRIRCEMEEEVSDAAELRQALNKRLPRGARLAGAHLQGVTLEYADLTEADLAGADLTKANLNHVRLDRAILRDAALVEAGVENASARDADFRNADLDRASFNQSDLTGSDLSGARNQSRESFVNSSLARVRGLTFAAGIDFESLRPVPQLGASNGVTAVALSPDGELIAAGSGDGVIRLYRTSDGALLRSLDGHSSSVRSVAFAPDGLTLASGSYDNSVKLWQAASGKLLQTFEGNLGQVYAVAFAPNGRYLVAAGAAGRLQFWDIASGETFLYRYSFGPGAWLALLPDGRFDASPEGMRYLGYTEDGTFNHYTAESLVKEFYAPDAVREVLEKYTK